MTLINNNNNNNKNYTITMIILAIINITHEWKNDNIKLINDKVYTNNE